MSFYPEGTESLPTDDPARSLKKWNQILWDTYGNVGNVPLPEGTQPLPGDSEDRSKQKINAIYKATQ